MLVLKKTRVELEAKGFEVGVGRRGRVRGNGNTEIHPPTSPPPFAFVREDRLETPCLEL